MSHLVKCWSNRENAADVVPKRMFFPIHLRSKLETDDEKLERLYMQKKSEKDIGVTLESIVVMSFVIFMSCCLILL